MWAGLYADGSVDPGKRGIADVRVYIAAENNGIREPSEEFAWIDETGSFIIDDLAIGD